MSKGASVPYKLRPNKIVDRELFVSFLSRLSATLKFENYQYIGLGGPFLEDFRLIHSRIGISDMVCVESNEDVHKRQRFNRPTPTISCVHNTLEGYINSSDFEKPVILWLDYTEPRKLADQIETFSDIVVNVPDYSVVRITLNANPGSLGSPDPGDIIGRPDGPNGIQEWRLNEFKLKMANLCPADLDRSYMTNKAFGEAVLMSLQLSTQRAMLSSSDNIFPWTMSTHYSDGQPMVTATIMSIPKDRADIVRIIEQWEHYSTPENPLRLDMPALSPLERLTLESHEDPDNCLDFELPKSDMKEDPIESFKRFYRVYPHFTRVDF